MFNKLFVGKFVALALIILLSTLPQNLTAQSTWSKVHAILQTSCAGTTCHSAVSPNPLTLVGTESDVYNSMVNVSPTNPDAVSRGYKLVDPGYPHFSFLLKKVNNGLDPDNDLDGIAQGAAMPKTAPPLSDVEIDIINAWILNGAPQTGNVIDTQVVMDYHNIGGLAHEDPLAAPNPADGFQIHFGSIFMEPNSEREFFLKRKLPNITENMEITRLETYIDVESHHYIIYKYDNQASADVQPAGLREVTLLTDAFVNGTTMVAAWQNENDIVLPFGTAYFWDPGTTLDMNLHVRNYSPDSILKAEVYTNVYLQPKKTSTTEMISDLVLYSTLPLSVIPCSVNPFCIPNDGTDYAFQGDVTGADLTGGGADSLYIWLLSSHTHKFGVGYNIYLRNPGGGKGQQVYDGFYDFDYTFYQGYYDYEDPAVRFFDPDTFVIKADDGLIHEATFNNDSTEDVGFGITTNDEMMLIFLQYTTERRTPPPIGLTVASTGLMGPGNCDGTATATPTGGDAPFTYMWDDPAAQTIQTATGLCEGTYTVTMTDGLGAMINGSTTIGAYVGIEKYMKKMAISVYPNPAGSNTMVTFVRENTNNDVFITLYDLLGKKVLTRQFPLGSDQLFLDKSELMAGVYMYKAWSNNGEIALGKLIMY